MIDILSAFGLSADTGLNAYLPLLVGLLARFTPHHPAPPWDALETVALALLAALGPRGEAAGARGGRHPRADPHPARPGAGAILLCRRQPRHQRLSPVLAMVCRSRFGVQGPGLSRAFPAPECPRRCPVFRRRRLQGPRRCSRAAPRAYGCPGPGVAGLQAWRAIRERRGSVRSWVGINCPGSISPSKAWVPRGRCMAPAAARGERAVYNRLIQAPAGAVEPPAAAG